MTLHPAARGVPCARSQRSSVWLGSGPPACDGACDPGSECRTSSELDAGGSSCACFPVDTTPCDTSLFPQCGGGVCPGGKACGGFEAYNPSSSSFGTACACVDQERYCGGDETHACVSAGYCPPGQVCLYTPIVPHAQCPCCGCGTAIEG